MAVPLSERLFIDYLQCKYKAYLKLAGKIGVKSDYERYQEERSATYHRCARAQFEQNHQIIPSSSAITSFKDIEKWKPAAAMNIAIVNESYNLTLDAVKMTTQASSGTPAYEPVMFLPHQKITKKDKLLLTFHGAALSREQKTEPIKGTIIRGDKYSSSRVQLSSLVKAVGKIEKEIIKMMELQDLPSLRLNDHCKICEFQESCYATAKEKDDLSLLKGLSGKEIDTLNKRGIFTVTQYSYTFRPRRAKKLLANKIIKHHHSLNALAVRTQTIYIAGKPALPSAKTRIFLDVEGIPGENFYYLIGLLIDDGTNISTHSLWADDKSEEIAIWKSFLEIIATLDDYVLFHFGSYETRFIKQMSTQYGGDSELLEKIGLRSFNVLSAIYGHIYFPTYSNDLKSIASFMGFKWSDENASGLRSILWRKQWERANEPHWKDLITTYNHDDCLALQIVQRAITTLSQNSSSGTGISTTNIDELQEDKPRRIFKKNTFYFPELDKINSCAYFDYQRSRVYCRTNAEIKKQLKKASNHKRVKYKTNSIINIGTMSFCPYCGVEKPRKYGNYSKLVYDLKMFSGGIKRWIVQYDYKRYSCKACRRTFFPDIASAAPHIYGRTLVAWAVNQNITRLQPYRVIDDELREIFGYYFRGNISFLFKQQMAQECYRAHEGLKENICRGSYIHVDETDINIMGMRGYVWVFANVDSALYLFQPTREGDFLKDILCHFHGVLISDFYTAYDSIRCPQQKCLIHLIRDINESILRNPFDDELKEMGKAFTQLLVPIIESVDRYGLKKIHLHKHKQFVDRFLLKIDRTPYSSEHALNFQRRIMKYRDKLFTFLDYNGIPWNNNNAEHAIKRFVQLRKVIGGSSTEKGIQEYLILLSICETLRLRNASFLKYLIAGALNIDEFMMKQKNMAA